MFHASHEFCRVRREHFALFRCQQPALTRSDSRCEVTQSRMRVQARPAVRAYDDDVIAIPNHVNSLVDGLVTARSLTSNAFARIDFHDREKRCAHRSMLTSAAAWFSASQRTVQTASGPSSCSLVRQFLTHIAVDCAAKKQLTKPVAPSISEHTARAALSATKNRRSWWIAMGVQTPRHGAQKPTESMRRPTGDEIAPCLARPSCRVARYCFPAGLLLHLDPAS